MSKKAPLSSSSWARTRLNNVTHQYAPVSQLVLIPSYNSGARLAETVADALCHQLPVWVVIDGSTDGSGDTLAERSGLTLFRRAVRGGKGAAVLEGLREAVRQGYTHVLVMDADGQHPAASIPEFFEVSRQHPDAMILGLPIFDNSAPWVRVAGRRLSNALARFETGGAIGDSLFGFRVYPAAALLTVMETGRSMRGYDFDAEAAVRLSWRGVPAINLPAPVRYLPAEAGGVSHFRYGRDNVLLAAMHARLLVGKIRKSKRSLF